MDCMLPSEWSCLTDNLERVLFTSEQIQARVRELGAQIAADYKDSAPVVIGILKGAVMFFADLARSIPAPIKVDFIATSSYGANIETSGVVRIQKDLDRPIAGLDILLVEDIVDSGLTLSYLTRTLSARQPRSIKVVALLDKPSRRKTPLRADYTGFTIDDLFVVGYGLDFDQRYRNIPMIGVLKSECYQKLGMEESYGRAEN